MKEKFSVFITGFIQVILVCLNTYQIGNYVITNSINTLIGIFVVGFLISFVWTLNVKKTAFGDTSTRMLYALGAALGSIVGVLLGELLYTV